VNFQSEGKGWHVLAAACRRGTRHNEVTPKRVWESMGGTGQALDCIPEEGVQNGVKKKPEKGEESREMKFANKESRHKERQRRHPRR